MSNVNSVVVSGNLTRDAEVKWLAEDGGSAIVNLGIAVNRSRKTDDGYEDEVSFFDIDVYGGFACLVGRKLRKGDAATIQGRLEQQTWETEGGKRSAVRIVAQTIDSEGFFRAKDEDAQLLIGGGEEPVAAAAAPAAEPKTDDIPF